MAEEVVETKWKQGQVIKLAGLLEANPVLWNTTLEGYKNRNVKFDAVAAIAREMKLPHALVDAKLKSIVTQFKRELQKKKSSKTGQAAGDNYIVRWYLYEHLQFLVPPTVINTTLSSATPVPSPTLHENDDGLTEKLDNDEDVSSFINADEVQNELQNPFGKPESSTRKPNFTKRYAEKRAQENRIANSVVRIAESLTKEDDRDDEWDALRCFVAKRIRGMKNPIIQLKTEDEIQKILFKKKMEDEGVSFVHVTPSVSTYDSEDSVLTFHS